MTDTLTLRRHQALNPHWFDLMHSRWAAPLKQAAKARFPVRRDRIGRFSHERNEA